MSYNHDHLTIPTEETNSQPQRRPRTRPHPITPPKRKFTMTPPESTSESDDGPVVPEWLRTQQRELVRNHTRTKSTSRLTQKQSSSASKQKHKQKFAPPDDDDLIMVDLLDGAHLHTRPKLQLNRMSSNSDSIISLPPIDDNNAPSRWQTLRAEAQEVRKTRRGGASLATTNLSQNVLRPPLPTIDQRTQNTPVKNTNGQLQRKQSSFFQQPYFEERHQSYPVRPKPSIENAFPVRPPDRNENPQNVISNLPSAIVVPLDQDQYRSTQPPTPIFGKKDILIAQDRAPSDLSKRENTPLLEADVLTERRTHVRIPSITKTREPHHDDDWVSSSSATGISNNGSSNNSRRRRKRRKRRPNDDFQPGVWGWKKPAEEDAIMPSGAWVYLALIGVLTFLIAITINASADYLSESGITRLANLIGIRYGPVLHITSLAILRGFSLAISFILVYNLSPNYSAGSGIPEMKCVLNGVLMPRMLNWKTLVAKMVGLVFSLSSSISIGRLGPFIHMSGITAALVSKIPWFPSLRSSARFQLQALSAAMAAGVGATFGAPIGGTMLSIEVMSTYYYIHWLPMALYCSIMGYYCIIAIVQDPSEAFFYSNVDVDLNMEATQRLVTYVVLGALCGIVGAALVHFTKLAFHVRRAYFTNSTPRKTAMMVFCFPIFHTFVTFALGGVIAVEQKKGVLDLINSTDHGKTWIGLFAKPFQYDHWNSSAGLLLAMLVKFFLTGCSLVMPVPAGTFMPIFEIGALLGRCFGEVCSGFSFVNWVDPRATAIIGAAAVTAGTLHTTSIAVVMLELTKEAIDILPLTIGVLISYGVSKHLCSDLFSEFIKIRRLPFILGLRERYPTENRQFYEDVSTVVAGSFMSRNFPYVTPYFTKGDIYRLLIQGGKPWINCAFLSDKSKKHLWGTVSQQALWDAIAGDLPGSWVSDDDIYGTFGQEGEGSRRANEPVPFLRNFDPAVGHPLVDMGPMQVSVHTPFWKIITFFRMLSMSTMYVVKDGETVGCVSKAQVISYSIEIEERAKRKRRQEKEVELNRIREEREFQERMRQLHGPGGRLPSRRSDLDLPSAATHVRRHSRQGSISRSRV